MQQSLPEHWSFYTWVALARSPKSLSMATSPTVCLKSSSSKPLRVTAWIAGRVSSNFPKRPLWELWRWRQYSWSITWVWSCKSSTWLGSHKPRHSKNYYNKFVSTKAENKKKIPALNKTRAFKQAYSVWSTLNNVSLVIISLSLLASSSRALWRDVGAIALPIKRAENVALSFRQYHTF